MAPRPQCCHGLPYNPLRSRQPRDTRHAQNEGGFRWGRLGREEIENISESRVIQKTNRPGYDFLIRPLHTQTHVSRLPVVSNLEVRFVCERAGSYRLYFKRGNRNVVGALEDRNAFDVSGNIVKSHAVRNQVNTLIAAQGGKTWFDIGRRKPADPFESFLAIRRKWKRRFA